MTAVNPVCRSCPVAQKPASCGYLAAHTLCQHPRQREAWLAAGGLKAVADCDGNSNKAGSGQESDSLCAEDYARGKDLHTKQEGDDE